MKSKAEIDAMERQLLELSDRWIEERDHDARMQYQHLYPIWAAARREYEAAA